MTTAPRKLITVISPLFNEAANVESLLGRIRDVAAREAGYAWEFVLVDDGSSDRTAEIAAAAARSDPRLKLLQLSRNFGHQVAITAGLTEAHGDAVISLDGDMQHPPELLSDFLRCWEQGHQVVVGVRNETAGGWFKRCSSRFFYWLINRMSQVPIRPGVADFRLLDRRVVDALLRMPERSRFIRGLVSWMGFDVAIVHYDEDSRRSGSSKFSLMRMIYFAGDAITSFSAVPLRVATLVGLVTVVGALCYALYILAVYLFRPEVIVPGWTSLLLLALWLGGIQLIFLGVIGEYLYRIFDEVKQRPLYLVKRKVGFDHDDTGT